MQRTRPALAATLDFRESSTAAAVTDRRGPLTAKLSARSATSAALTNGPSARSATSAALTNDPSAYSARSAALTKDLSARVARPAALTNDPSATSAALTLAPRSAARDGSQKYHELDLRRRRAQIRARRTLGLL
jgi:hypothetical protein